MGGVLRDLRGNLGGDGGFGAVMSGLGGVLGGHFGTFLGGFMGVWRVWEGNLGFDGGGGDLDVWGGWRCVGGG